ncbi:hypothetical protein MMAN_15950 [Mycobacterium mantenii]|uniref:Uncharacterized protein n=1 Tax=Mycobacterium mantenii TaxID=560555 RepID=A0A1X0FJU8_MYCNT|nr:hypothetical protein BST30_21090 [Mycobacterium mantenii]BBY37461.1 hypothetical protein MMAN_15950 [Mycobacterium mantenii]
MERDGSGVDTPGRTSGDSHVSGAEEREWRAGGIVDVVDRDFVSIAFGLKPQRSANVAGDGVKLQIVIWRPPGHMPDCVSCRELMVAFAAIGPGRSRLE